MRFLQIAFLICLAFAVASAQGSATLRNLSHPATAIEVGNNVEVDLVGANPYGSVTLTLDGSSAYVGQTDGFGNFSITATETAGYAGSHIERWYVDGVEVRYPDPSCSGYLGYQPALPFFNVYDNDPFVTCSSQSTSTSACGTGNSVYHWIWSPVTYQSTSSVVGSSAVDADAANWNGVQSKISFSNDTSNRQDVLIYDDSSIGMGTTGETLTYGQDCDASCYNHPSLCPQDGSCDNSAAVYYVDIKLNGPEIANVASCLDTDSGTLAGFTVAHEMGHALRLGDISAVNGICSEVQDVLYQNATVRFGCGVEAPNSCDTTGINTVYPSPVGYCPTSEQGYCDLFASCS